MNIYFAASYPTSCVVSKKPQQPVGSAAAVEHYANALRLRHDDRQTNYNLGLFDQAKGGNDRAEMFFNRAREANASQCSRRQ
ncbi:hypothetical protein [Rhizobium mesoamericanum]|uniref:Sel1 repeat family protein n=1 Tax=Rhizobium mesoamericanum STM3625 TaxID=1211777 RepID=K0Q592_9HYPH|nr:hypothetical protein [Rhizobium mesoamericanum]CCM78279.1 hypothetical protein BN77_p10936 [Rhizobium mesoamericanum STM3625]